MLGRRWATIASSAFLLAAVSAIRLHGQDVDPKGAAFEVASIKENKSGETRWIYDLQPGGRFKATSASLVNLISIAYGNPSPLSGFQVVGGPDWIRTKRFDLVAKADGNPAKDRFPLMLRTLLAERFNLRVRSEMRERETFDLVMARIDRRLGPRLRPTDGPSLFTAVQEQLGLRLEPRTEPVAVLTVDGAQQQMTD